MPPLWALRSAASLPWSLLVGTALRSLPGQNTLDYKPRPTSLAGPFLVWEGPERKQRCCAKQARLKPRNLHSSSIRQWLERSRLLKTDLSWFGKGWNSLWLKLKGKRKEDKTSCQREPLLLCSDLHVSSVRHPPLPPARPPTSSPRVQPSEQLWPPHPCLLSSPPDLAWVHIQSPGLVWPSDIWLKKCQNKLEKREHLQPMVLGKLNIHKQRNEIGPVSITLAQNWLQIDQRPKLETSRRKHR